MVADAPRTRVTRHDAEDGRWEVVSRGPDPRLRGDVRGYHGYAEELARPVRRREPPSGDVVLIVNFGAAIRVDHPRGTARSIKAGGGFVAGLHESFALVGSSGAQRGVEVRFTPLGAHRFLGLPMDALANRVVELGDLAGAVAPDLAARLAASPDWATRFAILDAVIAARLGSTPAAPAGVAWAWHQLQLTGGRAEIGALAVELGCSRRHLVAQFREQIGLPPKTVARILRFQGALRLLGRDDRPSWAEIAHRCGYYDQAHLIRDFRRFAGRPPGEFLRVGFLDGRADAQD